MTEDQLIALAIPLLLVFHRGAGAGAEKPKQPSPVIGRQWIDGRIGVHTVAGIGAERRS